MHWLTPPPPPPPPPLPPHPLLINSKNITARTLPSQCRHARRRHGCATVQRRSSATPTTRTMRNSLHPRRLFCSRRKCLYQSRRVAARSQMGSMASAWKRQSSIRTQTPGPRPSRQFKRRAEALPMRPRRRALRLRMSRGLSWSLSQNITRMRKETRTPRRRKE